MAAVFHPVNPFEQALIDSLPIEVLINLTSTTPAKTTNKKVGGPPERSGHRLRLHLYEARDLPAISWFSKDKTDSYVNIALQGTKTNVRSQTITETINPAFNEAWDFHLSRNPLQDVLLVTLYAHHSITSDDFLGRIEIPLAMILSLPAPRKMLSCWFPLLPNQTTFTTTNPKAGSVRIGFEYFFDPSEAQLRFLQDQATALAVLDSRKQAALSPTMGRAIQSVPYLPSPPSPPQIVHQQSQPQIRHHQHINPGYPASRQMPGALHPQPMASPTPGSERCIICSGIVPTDRMAAHVDEHFASNDSGSQATVPAPMALSSSQSISSMQSAPPGYRAIYPISSVNLSTPPQLVTSSVVSGENKYPMPTRPVPPPPLINLDETPEDVEARDLAEAIRQSEEFARNEQLRQIKPSSGAVEPLKAKSLSDFSSSESHLMEDLQTVLKHRNQQAPSAPPSEPQFSPVSSQATIPFPMPNNNNNNNNLSNSYFFAPYPPPPSGSGYLSSQALYPSVPLPYGVIPISQKTQ